MEPRGQPVLSQANTDREKSHERLRRKGQDIQKSEEEQVRRKPKSTPSKVHGTPDTEAEICPLETGNSEVSLIDPDESGQQKGGLQAAECSPELRRAWAAGEGMGVGAEVGSEGRGGIGREEGGRKKGEEEQ